MQTLDSAEFSPRPDFLAQAPVGDVIFDYVPLHPAHSNPKQSRRYLFTLLKQKERIDPVSLKQNIVDQARKRDLALAKMNVTFPPLQEASARLESSARSCVGPTWKFICDQNLEVAGYGFLRSSWNLYTPSIYKSLGIIY